MYGLVNKAEEQLVKTRFGEEKWCQIAAMANVEHSSVSMDTYPGAVTCDLVSAASEILDIPSAQILEAFGEHWIQYTVDEGYAETKECFRVNYTSQKAA